MKANCIYIPTVNVNGIEQNSKLFIDLLNTFNGNRDIVVPIYVASTNVAGLVDKKDLDEFREPTLNAVIENLDLLNTNINDFSKESLEKLLDVKDNLGNTIYYSNFNSAYEKIQHLNKKGSNNIGIIKYSNNGYYIDIQELTNENSDIINTQKLVYELNPKLKRIMNEFGFDVQRIDKLEADGVFSPENAEENANGLIDIIKLAKGVEGDYAFSEEFSHMLIAGMRDNAFVQRLFNVIDTDIAKDILGEEYETYKEKYSQRLSGEELSDLLREEAIGKLLAESLNKQNIDFQNRELFNRFKQSLMSSLRTKDESKIQEILDDVKNSLKTISEKVYNVDEEFFKNFSRNDVLDSKSLLKIKEKTKSVLEDISKRIFEIAAKEKQIASIKNPASTASERREFIKSKNERLKEAEKYYFEEKHKENCFAFLQDVSDEFETLVKTLQNIKNEIKNSKYDSNVKIGKLCYILNSVKNYSSCYGEVITNMLEMKDSSFSKEEKELLDSFCSSLLTTISKLEKSYLEARADVMKYWLETYYWKGNIHTGTYNEKGEEIVITLDMLLKEAPKDINFIDKWISEMGHSSDIMLNLISTITKKQMARRDQKLEDIDLRIKKMTKEFGDKTDFIYERDKNGKLTGRLISNIDYEKFEDAFNKFKETIDDDKLTEEEKHNAVVEWYHQNTEYVVTDKTNNRKEQVPNAKYRTNALSKLSSNQRRYYDEYMRLKAEMETLMGPANYHLYIAPQISSDYIQKFSEQGSLKDKINFVMSEIKTNFVRENDETEYGELDENGVKKVITDMNDKPIKKIPIYFVNQLKDMNRLSTDASKGLSAYCAMAVNYNEMSQIVNQIETFRDLLMDRDVKQLSGDNPVINLIRTGQTIIREEYKKKGSETNIGQRLDKYIDMVYYGMMKDDEGTVKIGEKEFDVAKNIDNLKKYEGLLGLGFNPFSGFSNISMGEVQMVIEAMANTGMSLLGGEKDTFGIRDWVFGHKEYLAALPKIIIEAESMTKTSKVGLLMRKFDTEQTFYEDLKNSGYYSNFGKRWLGNNSLAYIMQNMGEHYLHTILMISMLKAKKVLLNGKEVSLYDAYEVKDNKIVEKGEIKELDGKRFTNDKFIDFKLKIQELSHQFNGAFSAEDLGSLQSKAIGRLVAQFRQWMPGHYSRRFANRFYNTATKQYQEGYWLTSYRVTKEILLSLINQKRSIPEYWNGLSNYEKTNILKAISESLLLLSITMLLKGMLLGDDDDDDEKSRLAQFMKYQLYRTHMEIVATMPLTPFEAVQNMYTMLQTPMAAVNGLESAWKLLRIDNMFREIERGTYKGMSVWHRDALKAIPYYGQFRKFYDLSTEDYMFNMFRR